MFNSKVKRFLSVYFISLISFNISAQTYTISRPVDQTPSPIIFGIPDNLAHFTSNVFPKIVNEEIRKAIPISIYNIPLNGAPVIFASASTCNAKIIGSLVSGVMGMALDRNSLAVQLTPDGVDGVRISATLNPKIGALARFAIKLEALGCGRSYNLTEWEVALNKFSITINASLKVTNGTLQLSNNPPPQLTVNSVEGPESNRSIWIKSREGTIITDAASSAVSLYFGKSPAKLVSEILSNVLKSPGIAKNIMDPISKALIKSVGSMPSLNYRFSLNGLNVNSSLTKIGSINGMSGVAFSGQMNSTVENTVDRSCSRGISNGTENIIFLNRPRPSGGEYFLAIPHKVIGDLIYSTLQTNLCRSVRESGVFPTRLEPIPKLIFELSQNPSFTGSVKLTPEPMGTPSVLTLTPGARVNWSGPVIHDPLQISSQNPPRAPIALDLAISIPYRLTLPPIINGLENSVFQNGNLVTPNLVINNTMTANIKIFIKIRYDKNTRRILIALDKSSLQMTNVNTGVTDPALRAKVLPFTNMLQGLVRNKLISSLAGLPEISLSNEVMPKILGFNLILSGMEYNPVDTVAKFSLECISNCTDEIEEIHHCPSGWSRNGDNCTKGSSIISSIKTFRPLNEVEIRREFEASQEFKRLDPYFKTASVDINSHYIGINGINKIDCHEPGTFYWLNGIEYTNNDRNLCNQCLERSLGYGGYSINGKGWLWDISMRRCVSLECADSNQTDNSRSECMGYPYTASGSYTEPTTETAYGFSTE
jgi:hypothetical protein